MSPNSECSILLLPVIYFFYINFLHSVTHSYKDLRTLVHFNSVRYGKINVNLSEEYQSICWGNSALIKDVLRGAQIFIWRGKLIYSLNVLLVL